jgi:uncharacterized protein YcfL
MQFKKKRLFLKAFITIPILWGVSNFAFAQKERESKLRRTGSTGPIKIDDLRAVVRNGLLTVQVSLRNSSSGMTPINYRFKWLDDSGIKVSDDSYWKPMSLFGGQTIDIVEIATSPLASDFIIELNGSGN